LREELGFAFPAGGVRIIQVRITEQLKVRLEAFLEMLA
jgi:hypothetical protein